jgi:orotate phosphoribosyltransferase
MSIVSAMTNDEILALFTETGALLEGHFQLTSGLHSPQYFQCARVLQHPRHAERLCGTLAEGVRSLRPDCVVAPALGGIVVGQEVGRQLGVRTMFTERKDGAMELRRGFAIVPGERVVVCEDVVTTGGSVFEVLSIVKDRGGIPVAAAYIVDRSGGTVRFDVPQFSLLRLTVVTYPPDDCPLCRLGTPAVKPGSRAAR